MVIRKSSKELLIDSVLELLSEYPFRCPREHFITIFLTNMILQIKLTIIKCAGIARRTKAH